MAAGDDLPRLYRRQHGAALLPYMGAVLKLALPQVGGKLTEGVLQLLLPGQLHLSTSKEEKPGVSAASAPQDRRKSSTCRVV